MYKLLIFFLISIFSLNVSAASFPLPAVPDSLRQPAERANYIVEHFWDNAEFDNLDKQENSILLEQAFVDFITILQIAENQSKDIAVNNLIDRISQPVEIFNSIAGLAEKYLHEVDSPMKNEEVYTTFLYKFIDNPYIEDSYKIRWHYQLDFALKNRPGTPASDFEFTDRRGAFKRLYEVDFKDILLLLFYDPDCDHCKEVMATLVSDPVIIDLVDKNQLNIVAVYSGEEKELWDKTKNSLPEQWTVGYDDGSLQDDDIYLLRTMPTLYLLDRSRNVILKEANIKDIENFFHSHISQ